MTVTIVGMGLIGGSLALDLRANGFASRLIGVDHSTAHQRIALEKGLVDEICPLDAACKSADIVVIAIPVSHILEVFPLALNFIQDHAVVIDMGSTKKEIRERIADHPRRGRAVLGHPMAGTEYSGPLAAIPHLFHSKAAIICDAEESEDDAIRIAERLFKSLFMRIIYMNAGEHDVHAAYVSHISHISSFVLALTVLEKEKSEANIFNLASGGFASTVRLAKSSPKMWRDVYEQNAGNILDVLDSYLDKMKEFRNYIAKGQFQQTYQLMEEANEIGKILQ